MELITSLVSDGDNHDLMMDFSMDELKMALASVRWMLLAALMGSPPLSLVTLGI